MGNLYRSRQNGFVIILLLIVIVAGMLIYFNMAGGRMAPAERVDTSDSGSASYPWDFEDSIGAGLNYPLKEGQFSTDREFDSGLSVIDKATQQKRGSLRITLNEDGTVLASWSGTYKKNSDVEYDIVSASASGNVDPTIMYTDMDGKEDATCLYFIAKGKFIMMRSEKGHVTRPGGEIFVSGFYKPNGQIFGTINLTSDRQSQTVFDFGKEYDE